MDNIKNIRNIIYSFFVKNVSGNVQLHFQNWILKTENENEKETVLKDIFDEIDVEADESTYQDLKLMHTRINYLNKKLVPRHKTILRAAAILILPILASLITYTYIIVNESNTVIVQSYVPKGEMKFIELSDGSKVWINSESYLSYPKEFESDKRIVNLTGEAFFEVAKDARKPFIVQTSNMNIEVLGTKFNVNAYPDLIEVKTTLQEGRVKIDVLNGKSDNDFFLSPNEELLFNTATGSISKNEVDASEAFAWSKGVLNFNSVPLSDLFRQIEKKYDTRIVFSPSEEMKGKRLTVKFENNESVNDVFDILQLMLPDMKIEIQKNIVVVN